MKPPIPYLLSLLALVISLNCTAQTPYGIKAFDLLDSIETTHPDTVVGLTFYALLDDTIGIDSIHVKVGRRPIWSDITEANISFDQQTGLPYGMIYSRDGRELLIRLGSYNKELFYYEIRLEYSDGTYSLTSAGVK